MVNSFIKSFRVIINLEYSKTITKFKETILASTKNNLKFIKDEKYVLEGNHVVITDANFGPSSSTFAIEFTKKGQLFIMKYFLKKNDASSTKFTIKQETTLDKDILGFQALKYKMDIKRGLRRTAYVFKKMSEDNK